MNLATLLTLTSVEKNTRTKTGGKNIIMVYKFNIEQRNLLERYRFIMVLRGERMET